MISEHRWQKTMSNSAFSTSSFAYIRSKSCGEQKRFITRETKANTMSIFHQCTITVPGLDNYTHHHPGQIAMVVRGSWIETCDSFPLTCKRLSTWGKWLLAATDECSLLLSNCSTPGHEGKEQPYIIPNVHLSYRESTFKQLLHLWKRH